MGTVVRSEGGVKSPPFGPWDIDCSRDEVLTKQEFAKDCDVNQIIARCVRFGMPIPAGAVEGAFMDVSEIGSYADCLRRITAAQEVFMQLPVEIRSEFKNDPGLLIDFVSDGRNYDRAVKLGLIEPKASKEVKPPDVSPPAK